MTAKAAPPRKAAAPTASPTTERANKSVSKPRTMSRRTARVEPQRVEQRKVVASVRDARLIEKDKSRKFLCYPDTNTVYEPLVHGYKQNAGTG